MLEEYKNKFKEIFSKKNVNIETNQNDSKRKIENLVVFIVILIITVILINTIWNSDKKEQKEIEQSDKIIAKARESIETNGIEENTLEQKLENILQKIDGVGNVKVLLTYSESSKTLAMFNEDSTKSDTEEQDTSGGNRKVSQVSNKKEVIYKEVNGEKIPVTQSIINPKIEGAIITAVGASRSSVKTNIIQAVEAATGLATHKIQVFEMKN